MTSLRNVLQDEMDRSETRLAHDSSRFPGHENRLASHAHRIHSSLCECGSGKPYVDCCMSYDHQRSSARISYSLPRSVHPDVTTRCEIEDHLRLRAFNAFYKASRQEHDLLVRFARAIVASAGPIKDSRLVRRWHGQFCKRPSRKHPEACK